MTGVYGNGERYRGEAAPLVFAFTCGWLRLNTSFFLEGEPGRITVPATAFLIEHRQGLAVFDTGLGPRFLPPSNDPAAPVVRLSEEDRIDRRLEAIGVDPAQVRWIISSHLHLDHAGGNSFLPEATLVVQASEWDYAHAGIDSAYHLPEVDTGHRLLKIHGEHDLFGDGSVVIFPTPGHTPGHQSARVRTMTGEVLLAADCCNLRRSLDEMRLPDHVHDAAAYRDTLGKLGRLRDQGVRIFYGHDPDDWSLVPQGQALSFSQEGQG